jgi:predicted DCC family thiol-disulfide oxidoreductase YuxK
VDEPETLFYDGGCGLCHRSVRFVTWADRGGRAFRFAPLRGETFRALVREPEAGLPDSLVVRTADGRVLTRFDGVLHVLDRLGGFWRGAGALASLLPRAWGDAAYDAVARIRHRLFAPPPEACPVTPPELRKRFDP